MTYYRQLTIFLICVSVSIGAAAADAPLWIQGGKPTRQAEQLSHAIDSAESYGLSPAAYASALSSAQLELVAAGKADAGLMQRYDEDLSRRAARFARHLQYGRVSARAAGFDLPTAAPNTDTSAVLTRIATASNVDAEIAALEPKPVPYRLLKQTLPAYRQLARDSALQTLPAPTSRSVQVGDEYAGAPQLRRLLVALGDLPADTAAPANPNTIDAALAEALKHFQSRHGLAPDGVLGKQTLVALNVPLHRRVRQIELSMERWRWLGTLQRPDIVVNIPQFMLYALPRPDRPGEQLLEMPVIVGRTGDRTPIFTSAIEEVVFNPYWDVPTSILRNELLPKIRNNASYLERHHFEIVNGGGDNAKVVAPSPATIEQLAAGTFRLRQRPGPDNALGPVKFMLPNPYSIRLHGTAEPQLFGLSQRALSHGCIRVSDPAALTEYVLANAPGDWNTETVEAALCGTQPRRVKLSVPVRVVIFYATAAATVSRGVLFSTDLYGHDAKLEQLLARPERS